MAMMKTVNIAELKNRFGNIMKPKHATAAEA